MVINTSDSLSSLSLLTRYFINNRTVIRPSLKILNIKKKKKQKVTIFINKRLLQFHFNFVEPRKEKPEKEKVDRIKKKKMKRERR